MLEETEDILSDEEEVEDDSAISISLQARLSSILFVSSRPLDLAKLAQAAQANVSEVEEALESLKAIYIADVHGFTLEMINGGYCFRTTPESARFIKRLIPPRAKKLSKAAAETLAVVAYKQPVQRSEIESIRGVDALPTIRTLLDAKLIRIVGREDSVGQPALYGTTRVFLEKFGMKDLSELPTVNELEELSQETGE